MALLDVERLRALSSVDGEGGPVDTTPVPLVCVREPSISRAAMERMAPSTATRSGRSTPHPCQRGSTPNRHKASHTVRLRDTESSQPLSPKLNCSSGPCRSST